MQTPTPAARLAVQTPTQHRRTPPHGLAGHFSYGADDDDDDDSDRDNHAGGGDDRNDDDDNDKGGGGDDLLSGSNTTASSTSTTTTSFPRRTAHRSKTASAHSHSRTSSTSTSARLDDDDDDDDDLEWLQDEDDDGGGGSSSHQRRSIYSSSMGRSAGGGGGGGGSGSRATGFGHASSSTTTLDDDNNGGDDDVDDEDNDDDDAFFDPVFLPDVLAVGDATDSCIIDLLGGGSDGSDDEDDDVVVVHARRTPVTQPKPWPSLASIFPNISRYRAQGLLDSVAARQKRGFTGISVANVPMVVEYIHSLPSEERNSKSMQTFKQLLGQCVRVAVLDRQLTLEEIARPTGLLLLLRPAVIDVFCRTMRNGVSAKPATASSYLATYKSRMGRLVVWLRMKVLNGGDPTEYVKDWEDSDGYWAPVYWTRAEMKHRVDAAQSAIDGALGQHARSAKRKFNRTTNCGQWSFSDSVNAGKLMCVMLCVSLSLPLSWLLLCTCHNCRGVAKRACSPPLMYDFCNAILLASHCKLPTGD
jgi:hypothetical protein